MPDEVRPVSVAEFVQLLDEMRLDLAVQNNWSPRRNAPMQIRPYNKETYDNVEAFIVLLKASVSEKNALKKL